MNMKNIKKINQHKQFRKHQAKLALMALTMSNPTHADLTTDLSYLLFTQK
jgi:hypothetical protein